MDSNRAILWNLDGTLIDSEDLHWIAWRNTLALEGVFITYEQFRSAFGQCNESILSRWLGSAATPECIARIASAKENLYCRKVRSRGGIAPLPGVVLLLHRLHEEGWQQAVVSTTAGPGIREAMEVLPAALFQTIVGAEDVRHGKPDPEAYLTAAARIGATPDGCIAVESSPMGVEGALGAGIRTVAVGRHCERTQADLVVEFLELLEVDTFTQSLEKRYTLAGHQANSPWPNDSLSAFRTDSRF